MNNHSKRDEQQRTIQVSEIENNPIVRRARKSYLRQLNSHVPEFQKEKNGSNGGRGQVVKLSYICKRKPFATSESEKDEKNRTVITRHFYEKVTVCVLIPKNAKFVEVPEYPESPAHYRVRFGDGFCFFPKKIFSDLKPGDTVEGTARIEVKKVIKSNQEIKMGYYPQLSFEDPFYGATATYFASFDSEKRLVPKGSIDLSPASGNKRTILHLTKMEPISPGITVKRK